MGDGSAVPRRESADPPPPALRPRRAPRPPFLQDGCPLASRVGHLTRRVPCSPAAKPQPAGEVAQVLGIPWAHTTPEDGVEHITGSLQDDRVDLLMYLLLPDPAPPRTHSPLCRAAALLARSHHALPAPHRRYLPPAGTPGSQADEPGHAAA